MKASTLIVSSMLLTMLYTSTQASESGDNNLHPKVAAALSWELPVNGCGDQPESLNEDNRDENVSGFEMKRSYGTDATKRGRYKRREKRWVKCVTEYNQSLIDGIRMLQSSAKHGITEPQGKAILQKMIAARDILTAEPTQQN